jgi:hypothetical protein
VLKLTSTVFTKGILVLVRLTLSVTVTLPPEARVPKEQLTMLTAIPT